MQDRLVLRGLGQVGGQDQLVFILATREEGQIRGIKYRMTGKMITASPEAAEGVDVQIMTPCMEKIGYKVATSRNGSNISSLMKEVESEGVKESLASMKNNISPNFEQKANSLSKKIISLEEASRAKSEDIIEAKRKLDEKFENSLQLKKIRGIQSDLETAVGWVMKDVNMNIQDDVGELAILENDPLNSSMTTNVVNEIPDLPPSSQDSF